MEYAEKVIATNYYGTKNMIKAMIPLMRHSSSGARIVNVSSRLGRLNGRRNVRGLLFHFHFPSLCLFFSPLYDGGYFELRRGVICVVLPISIAYEIFHLMPLLTRICLIV